MVEKRRIDLEPVEGDFPAYLEIERHDNGDLLIEFSGNGRSGEEVVVRAQCVNPVNGGGDAERYGRVLKVFYSVSEE
jgi:hypothetical protein